jgi:hypothetical protein
MADGIRYHARHTQGTQVHRLSNRSVQRLLASRCHLVAARAFSCRPLTKTAYVPTDAEPALIGTAPLMMEATEVEAGWREVIECSF